MINISQSGEYRLHEAATKYKATFVISITQKGGKAPPTPEGILPENHYTGFFDDYYKDVKFSEHRTPPTKADIEGILNFVKKIKDPHANLFIHCSAGVSRSTAMTIGIYYMLLGAREDKAEDAVMLALESVIGEKANSWPSDYITALLDEIFNNKNKALSKAVAKYKATVKSMLGSKKLIVTTE